MAFKDLVPRLLVAAGVLAAVVFVGSKLIISPAPREPAAPQQQSNPKTEAVSAPATSKVPTRQMTEGSSAPPPVAASKGATQPVAPGAVAGSKPVPRAPVAPSAPAGNLRVDPPLGARAVAKVNVKGSETKLLPDQNGEFARVLIDPRETVAVQLSFPEGAPGQQITVQVADGGVLDGKAPGKALKLDDSKNITFSFRANEDPGLYRVLVSKGGDVRQLNFWVGPELPVANR